VIAGGAAGAVAGGPSLLELPELALPEGGEGEEAALDPREAELVARRDEGLPPHAAQLELEGVALLQGGELPFLPEIPVELDAEPLEGLVQEVDLGLRVGHVPRFLSGVETVDLETA
jgi:hypothetical protein